MSEKRENKSAIRIIDKYVDERLTYLTKVCKCELEGSQHHLYLREGAKDFSIFEEIFKEGCYDIRMNNSKKYKRYREVFNLRQPQNIIDIGGNIGLASIYYARQYPQAKIITIEPEKDNFYLLEKNIQDYSNIIPIRGAVWDKNTNLSITNRSSIVFTAKTKNTGDFMTGEEEIAHEEKIPAYTIDTIIEQYNIDRVDVLKIDIEGGEREIFNGDVEKWLPKVNLLVIEQHDFKKPGATKAIFKAISKFDFYYFYDHSKVKETMMFLMNQK